MWAGGHLVLSIGFLPQTLKHRDLSIIQHFEKHYERVGIPALLIQVITGAWMALIYVPVSSWLTLTSPHHVYLWTKFALLAGTLVLAVHARFFIIPKLTVEKLPQLAFHIVLVSVLAVSFVVVGLSFRFSYP